MSQYSFIIIVQKSKYPQMGALYLSYALSQVNITTHIVDSNVSLKALDELIRQVDPIAVGCSVMTAPEIVDFIKISMHIQEKYNFSGKKIPVIWGGMHSTIVSGYTEKESYIDYVISGEAEITLPAFLKDLLNGKLPEKKLIQAKTSSSLDDFRPMWEKIDLSKYLFSEAHSVHSGCRNEKQHIFYYLLSSRGCPYRCNFCWEVARTKALKAESSSVDLTWRAHSAQWVRDQLDTIEASLKKQGLAMDGVGFWDDMIVGKGLPEHNARAKEIFNMMRQRNFGYLLEMRANQLILTSDRWNDAGVQREADLYKFLKETGCMQVFVGTESGSQETLNLIQKGTKLEDYLRLVEISHDVGLPLRFSMIVGFPDESEQSINSTLDLIEKMEKEPFVSISGPKLFTPYPGTPQYEAAVRHGFEAPQTTADWARINRYSDFRSFFPWLKKISNSTLSRIDHAFNNINAEKKYQASEETILNLVRGH